MLKQGKGLKKIIIVLVFIIVLFIIAIKLKQKPPEDAAIKIGFLGDFSNDKLTSENALAAIKIAIDDVNKNSDKKFELAIYDIRGNEENIENSVKSANADNVLALITTLHKYGILPTQEKIPTIYVGGIKNESKQREEFYWSMRLTFVKSYFVSHYFTRIQSRYVNLSKAVLISDNEMETSKTFIDNLDLNVMEVSTYLFSNNEQIKIIQEVKKKYPDVILLLTNPQNTIKFLKSSKENGLEDKLFLVFLPTSKEILNEAENFPNRLLILTPPVNILGVLRSPENPFEEFYSEFFDLTGKSVSHLELNSYDAANLITSVISKADIKNIPGNINENRERVIRDLWAVKDFPALRGSLTPNGVTGVINRNYISTFYIKDGRFKSARGVIV